MILKTRAPISSDRCHREAFTLLDLVATVTILTALSLLAVPSLSRAALTGVGTSCEDNQRQITAAWLLYAADHQDRLVNNYVIPDTQQTVSQGKFNTWAPNILDWSTTQSNTNQTYLQKSKLFPYLQGNTLAFKCPADTYRSAAQTAAGWTGRIRSYSMNVFVGRNGFNDTTTNSGMSFWVGGKRQFLKPAAIPDPADTIVFLDEHPDSINDGVFINDPALPQWGDLPGSQHAGGCGVGFADGHGEIHMWVNAGTKVPVRYSFLSTPPVGPSGNADFKWLTSRMAVDPTALAANRRTNGVEIAWSALSTNYVLEAKSDLNTGSWTPIEPKPIADYGTKSITVDTSIPTSFFRLHKY